MASTIHSACGKNTDSSSTGGVIQLRAPSTTGGASRSSKHRRPMVVAMVCSTLPRSHASEVSRMRPVLRTDSAIGP